MLQLIERTVEREPKVNDRRCVDGARACPPDDVGGTWGYAELVDAMADASRQSHDQQNGSYEDEFDPEEFLPEKVNPVLRP
ncbi:MAG: IS1096 element passenger TnpR family protein [Isosphaeraceae bacterium]